MVHPLPGAVLSCFVKKVPKETTRGEAEVGMSSTQTPPPPKTPLWWVDWWCVQNYGAVFFAPSLRGLSADQADWGSVVLEEYTPSVFGYAESTSLKEGGYFIAACGDVILQGKMTGPSGRPVPTRSIERAQKGSPLAAMSFRSMRNDREGQAPPLHRG